MPGGLGQRAGLAEAGHAAEHQAGVARQAHLGAQAQALGHAGAPALDQHIGAVDQAQRGIAAGRLLDIQRHRAAAAAGHVERRGHGHAQAAGLGAVDADHVGAQIGQQHRAHRAGTDAGQFDHAQSGQGSVGHGCSLLVGSGSAGASPHPAECAAGRRGRPVRHGTRRAAENPGLAVAWARDGSADQSVPAAQGAGALRPACARSQASLAA